MREDETVLIHAISDGGNQNALPSQQVYSVCRPGAAETNFGLQFLPFRLTSR